MTESTELLLFNANTTKHKEKNNSLLLTEKNYTAALIGIYLYGFIFIFVHSISWMLF